MSKISIILRSANKQGEQPVTVRHSHKGSEFTKATGVAVPAKYIDLQTGKVSKLTTAPELNKDIQAVWNDVAAAARNLDGKGVEPLKPAMAKEYDRILTERATRERVAPKITRFLLSHIDELKAELVALELAVVNKRKEIEAEELKMGIWDGKLLAKHIADYAKAKEKTASVNTTRIYNNVAAVVAAYNPTLATADVTPDTLRDIEEYLIGSGKRNLTITDTITKIKTVIYYYAKALGIDTTDIKAHKTDVKKKKNPNVVYLTKSELEALINLPIAGTVEGKIRDRFVLMCLTGVRYSDSSIKPENIFNNNLLFSTEKTDTDIIIPMSDTVKALLEKYDNNIPAYPSQHFNKYIKTICSRVEELQYQIQLKDYKGKNKPEKSVVYKYEAITAHVARKTFINLALEKGVSPVAIASIVGHEGTELIMKTYGSSEAGRNKIADLLNEE